MNNFLKTFVFALIVTLGMNAMDMLFHVATDTAVHLNYVAVKFTIVFVTVFLIAWLIGIARVPGIKTAFIAPIMFYIYYRMATPTIDHTMFKIDDAVWYIFIHAIALGISYWLATRVMSKGDKLSVTALTGLVALPLHWGWIMFVIKWTGGTDEATLTALSLSAALLALVFLWVIAYLANFIPVPELGGITGGVVFAIFSMVLGATLIGGVARILVFGVPYVLVNRVLRCPDV